MPVNSTHPEYDSNLASWERIRDVLLGDAAIKRGGDKYVPRLDSQSDSEFEAYVERGFFYNATARTLSGYIGMIFRRDPVLLLPDKSAALHPVLKTFGNDVDLLGTTLDSYSKNVISAVNSLGRAGTLVDWHGESEICRGEPTIELFFRLGIDLRRSNLSKRRNGFWRRFEGELDYLLADARAAFLERIKLAHPDRGGDSEEAKSLSVAWNAIRRRFAKRGIRL